MEPTFPCKIPINILVIGGNYVGKGAEAMMLVVRDQLREFFPDARFWAMPQHAGEIGRYLRDGFCVVHTRPLRRVSRVMRLSAALTGIRYRKLAAYPSGVTLNNLYRVADIIVDVAGFASSDQLGPRNARSRWLNYVLARPVCRNVIFMPQSWGPFCHPHVRRFTRWTLKHALLVGAREHASRQFLMEAGCAGDAQIQYCPDIAFLFKAEKDPGIVQRYLNDKGLLDPQRPFIAVTPNMRIYERVEGVAESNRYLAMLLTLLRHWLSQTTCNIVLIPHEASWKKANDLELCALLSERLAMPERVAMLSGSEPAGVVKAVIGSADFLLASRYHSLVAALSLRVPVAVVGWSHKYDELMEAVGLQDAIVDPVRRDCALGVECILAAWSRRTDMVSRLNQRVPALEAQVTNLFALVAKKIWIASDGLQPQLPAG